MMRSGGTGRRRGDRRKPVRAQRAEWLAIRDARLRFAELKPKMGAKRAMHKVAGEAHKSLTERGYNPSSVARLIRLIQSKSDYPR